MRPDWTVPFDDLMTARFRMCQFCGQAADALELRAAEDGFALPVATCQKCRAADPREERRQALVEARARHHEQTLL
jgi:hypothetical protein